MNRITLTIFCVIVVALAGCQHTAKTPSYSYQTATMDADYYVARVGGFQVIADDSLSMADRSGNMKKYEVEAELLGAMARSIPEVGSTGGLRSFGQGSCVSTAKKTDLLVGMDAYSADDVAAAAETFQCANKRSPLDAALAGANADFAGIDGQLAVVIVSDGRHMKKTVIAEAQGMKDHYGDRICYYPVLVGNDNVGRKLMQKLTDVGSCGFLTEAIDLQSASAMQNFVEKVFVEKDSDGDGVADSADECPDTPRGVKVDAKGCPLDSDGDGVADDLDACANTPAGVRVDSKGCPPDSDGDGVADDLDRCPDTKAGVKVDAKGCPLDSDGDGVLNDKDLCPNTPAGKVVDAHGCAIKGIERKDGLWHIEGKVLFDVNKSEIHAEAFPALNHIAEYLKAHPGTSLEVQGHTDKSGGRAFNDRLSTARAEMVKAYLVDKGVDAASMTAKGYAWDVPMVPNDSTSNREKNRRVDFLEMK